MEFLYSQSFLTHSYWSTLAFILISFPQSVLLEWGVPHLVKANLYWVLDPILSFYSHDLLQSLGPPFSYIFTIYLCIFLQIMNQLVHSFVFEEKQNISISISSKYISSAMISKFTWMLYRCILTQHI